MQLGIVGHTVDISRNGNGRNDLHRDRVDLVDCLIGSVGGKHVSARGIDRNAMHRTNVDLPKHLSARAIGNQQRLTAGVRGVDAMPRRIDDDVVKPAHDRNRVWRKRNENRHSDILRAENDASMKSEKIAFLKPGISAR
jgi:hypothetical protein